MHNLHTSNLRWLMIIAVFVFLTGNMSKAQTPKSTLILGRFYSLQTKQPVAYALVVNKSKRISLACDSSGYFRIAVSPKDTIVASRIGFYPKIIVINDSILQLHKIVSFYMLEKTYDLNPIKILNLGTYQQFKRTIVDMKLPADTFQINPEITKAFEQKVVVLQEQMAIPIMHPVTAVYMLLSKEGKSLRKLAKETEKEKAENAYKDKYSPEIVSQLTGLKELELEKFMKYCNLDLNFIKISNEYDIAERVLIIYKQYLDEKEHPKPVP